MHERMRIGDLTERAEVQKVLAILRQHLAETDQKIGALQVLCSIS